MTETQQNITRHYYHSSDAKQIKYYLEKLKKIPEGFVYCGLSELPIVSAAGFYAKNVSGYTIIDGDKPEEIEIPETTE